MIPNNSENQNFNLNFNQAYVMKTILVDLVDNLTKERKTFLSQHMRINNSYYLAHSTDLLQKLKDHIKKLANEREDE